MTAADPRRGQATTLAGVWERFWFADGDPRNLAAARIIVALHALWILLSRDIPAMSRLPRAFWYTAWNSVAPRFLLFPGMSAVERSVEAVAAVALVMVALGVGVRYAAVVAAIALYHLGPLQTLLATANPINRGFTIAILCLVVLAAAPCAERWSLAPRRAAAAEPWEHAWPLRLMWLFVAEIYLFGAVGKLRVSGFDWFSPENLRRNLTLFLHMHPGVSDPFTTALASRPLILHAAAFGVLLLEGGFILAVWSRPARRVMVPAALLMHLCILRTMRIVFANIAHLGLFMNWGWLADHLTQRPAAQSAGSSTTPSPSVRPRPCTDPLPPQ
jgi:hypothetical protein